MHNDDGPTTDGESNRLPPPPFSGVAPEPSNQVDTSDPSESELLEEDPESLKKTSRKYLIFAEIGFSLAGVLVVGLLVLFVSPSVQNWVFGSPEPVVHTVIKTNTEYVTIKPMLDWGVGACAKESNNQFTPVSCSSSYDDVGVSIVSSTADCPRYDSNGGYGAQLWLEDTPTKGRYLCLIPQNP